MLFSHWMEAFEQTLSLQKDGDGGFVKIPLIGTVAYNFIKGNKNTPTKYFDIF